MEIKFADSFFESFEKALNRQRWYWRAIDYVRYDIPKGIKNIFFFWSTIWKFRPYDSGYQLRLFAKSLEPLAKKIENGYEVEVTKLKKVAKIKRLIEILNNIADDCYIELAEKELGYEVNCEYLFEDEPDEIGEANRKIFDLSNEIKEKEWIEAISILKGQDHSAYIMLADRTDPNESRNLWDTWFDGSGVSHWWT